MFISRLINEAQCSRVPENPETVTLMSRHQAVHSGNWCGLFMVWDLTTHRPRQEPAREHIRGGRSDQRSWSRPLGPAERNPTWKACVLKGKQRREREGAEKKTTVPSLSKLWNNWKGMSIKGKRTVGTERFPCFFVEGATGQGEMMKGATCKIKDLQASWEKLEKLCPIFHPVYPLLPF